MATMTIAQALASTATGILVSDTPVNIAAAAGNASLVSRVVSFTMSANAASSVAQAKQIYSLGSKFSRGGYTYTVRDTVAALKDASAAQALAGLNPTISVYDNATNLLAAFGTSLMTTAASTVLSANATLTLANLLKLESLPSFSVLPGQAITLADTAANLLALTAAANRAAIKTFQVVSDGTVTLSQAQKLVAMPSFAVVNGATLTVAGAAAVMTTGPAVTSLSSIGQVGGVAISIADTFTNLRTAAAALTTISQSATRFAVTMSADAAASAVQIAQLVPLSSKFSVAPGKTLTLADTAQNLIAASPSVTAMAQASQVSQSATITPDQLVALAALHAFSLGGGVQLTVGGTLAALNALTPAQLAFVAAETVQDTVTALTAASGMPALTTAIVAQLDAAQYTAAQAAQLALLANGTALTLAPAGPVTALTIADTLQSLAAFAPTLAVLLSGHGTVIVTPTNSNVTLSAMQVLSLMSLNTIDLSAYGVSVADSGAAIAANAGQFFGHGLVSINVTSGVFGGTLAQLLDPALHFAGATSPFALGLPGTFSTGGNTPSAQLTSNATIGANQLIALSLLPGFSVASGVTLMVQDSAATLAANAVMIGSYATAVTITDTAMVTAAQAAALASIKGVVGAGNFSLGGHALTISDSVAALTDTLNADGVALAASLVLASDAVATAAQATLLVGFGGRFSLDGHALTIIDSAASLASLAANGPRLTAVNAWGGQVVLSADATLTVAGAQGLKVFTGFSAGNHQLTISDTAANLLSTGATGALAIATGVMLSANAVVSVSGATTLAALHGFSANGKTITVNDTPAHIAAMSAAAALIATSETFVARNTGNGADFTLSAAQLNALMGLANVTASGVITLSDTADALLPLAPAFASIVNGSVLARVVVSVSADVRTTVANAMTLVGLPGFSLAGHTLTVQDTPTALLTQAASVAFGYASAVGIGGPATVSVATAAALAALSHFAPDAFALTIADTPAQLAHMSPTVAAIATTIVVAPSGGQPIGDYTVSAAEFVAITALPTLSFAGFSGAITVVDSAANLGTLATAMASAALGSPLAIARGAAAFALSVDATVQVAGLATLASLPALSLNGHSLTLQDTPTALLAGTIAGLPLATSVVLANATQTWVVNAANAARLAMLPGFSTGSAGMSVVDTAAAILAPQNAGGLSAAGTVVLSADAAITAADATHFAAMTNFTLGTAHLTIQDRAGALAALSMPAAALAASIVVQGSSLISVDQFTALRALPHLTTDGGSLIVVDSAANLATLAGSSTTLATLIMLGSNATLTAAQAEVLALLPHFVGGGAQITVMDSAANLLRVTGAGSLPDNWDGELIATTVVLSTDATITAGQASEFALLGTRFSLGGHSLTVADTAANLISRGNGRGLALATSVVLGTSVTLSATQATQLAGIAGIALGSGITLTVQDTVANLIALSVGVQALATAERLAPSTMVTVTAQQAAQLGALAHFSNAGATVTVSDTIANLNSVTGWQAVATTYVVADTLAHLTAAASTSLVTNAGMVMPTSGGDIDGATATILAGIPHFSAAGMPISVTDVPAQISANAAGILTIGATARIDATLPITATQADLLVALNNAGKLQTVPGITVLIQDSYAALISTSHTAGLALATAAIVLDTPANVLTAAAHNWGSLAMSYALSSGGTVTGAQGTTLATLGTHFMLNGRTLVMADTAAGVVANAAALTVLGIVANVTDTVAHVVANVGGLIASGTRLALVTLTSSTAITAAQADALQYLAPVLAGSTLTVNDTAVAIGQNLPNLLALGVHVGSVTVTDRAANVAGWVSTIQSLGSALSVVLTDTAPVSVATAAAMVPLLARLATSTSLDVQDTGSAIAGQATSLASLGSMLGTVTLSDGTTVTAGVAAGLVPIASHLGMGIQLDVADTAAALIAATTSLNSLRTAGRIHTLVASRDTASHIVASATALASLSATATVLDTGAHVLAALDALQPLSGSLVTSIALTDVMPPALAMTVNTLSTDHAALMLITSPFTIGIYDTAAHIQADLASGSSTLVGSLGWLGSVIASDMGGITLTEARAVAAGVADGLLSVMHQFSGGAFTVTNVLVSQIPTVAGLTVRPSTIMVADTALAIQNDLASGSSKLLANRLLITSIAVGGTGTITLTAAQVRLAHVDDGTDSLFALMTGETLIVSGVLVSDIPTILALGVPPASITVSDSALAIQTDLVLGGAGNILSNRTQIGAIQATGGSITLTETQVLVAHVNDGTGSAFSKITGATLTVTQVPVADIGMIASLGVAPASIRVNDTAANIRTGLISGSNILGHLNVVTNIAVSDGGTISLTTAQAAATGVDDGVNSALAKMTGGTFIVTGALVANFATIDALQVLPSSVAVSDSASNIQADLATGSVLVGHNGRISTITVSGGSTITLTTAQAAATGVDDGAGSVLAKVSGATLTITGAAITDFPALDALTVHATSISISDTLAHVQADLISGTSKLLAHVASLGAVAISDVGAHTLTLTVAQLRADAGVLAQITGSFTVDISDSAAQVQADLADAGSILRSFTHLGHISFTDSGTANLTLSVGQLTTCATVLSDIITPYLVVVNDTAGAVETDLALGVTSKILGLGATRGGIFVPTGSTIHLTATQVMVAGVVGALTGMTGRTGLAVSNASLTQFSTIYAYGVSGTAIEVRDVSSAVLGDLTSGSSQLELHVGALSKITLTNGTPIFTLNLTQLAAAGAVLAKVDVATPYQVAVADTAAAVQGDLAMGASSLILTSLIASVTVPSSSTITLTGAQAAYAGVGAVLATIAGLTSVVVNNASFAQFSTIAGVGGVPGLSVHVVDSATNLQADLVSSSSVLVLRVARIADIQVSDGSSVNIVLNLAQISTDASVLAKITVGTYHLTVSDTASHVQADLQSGSSIILNNTHVTTVLVPAGGTVTLTMAQAIAAGSHLAGAGLDHYVVTGVDVAHISTLVAFGVAHTELQVVDSGTPGDIATDLSVPGSSVILANPSKIASLTTTGIIELPVLALSNTALVNLVKTGITGITGLTVDNATVSDVSTVLLLAVSNTKFNIVDTPQHVQADLMGSGTLLANVGQILSISVGGGTPTITLSLAALAMDVTVLTKMSGFTLAISDTAANIVADLTSGSSVIMGPSGISGVTLTGGTTISLTDAQLTSGVRTVLGTMTGLATIFVEETPVSRVATVAGYSIGGKAIQIDVLDTAAHVQSDLTGAAALATALAATKLNSITLSDPSTAISLNVTQLTSGVGVLGKIGSAYHVAITDTAANVAGDLANQATSKLLGLSTHLQAIGFSANADLTLSVATATYAGVAALVNSIPVRDDIHTIVGRQDLVVTGASVAQIPTVLALGVSATMLSISDSAAHVQTDLTTGSHALATNIAVISAITMTGTAITLTVAQADAGSAVLTKIGAVSVDLTINDTADNVGADLALAVSSGSKILNNAADHITLASGTAISLSQAQLAATGVAAAVASITGLTTLHVTATPVGQVATVSAYSMGGITVDMDILDTAAAIEANLQDGGSTLVAARTANKLHIVTMSDVSAQVIHLNVAQLGAAVGVLGLITAGPAYTVAVTDTVGTIVTDLQLGSNSVLAGLGTHRGAITLSVGGGTIALTATQVFITGVGAAVAAITNQGAFNVSGATVAQVGDLAALGVSNTHIAVSDAYTAVQTDLTTGSHTLATNIGVISSIAMTGGSAISLTVAQANAGSAVLTKIGAGSVTLTVADTAAHVAADLANAALHIANSANADSVILSNSADAVSLSDTAALTLTYAQANAAGVASALLLTTGPSSAAVQLSVTGVLAADVNTLVVTTLSGIATMVTVVDTLAHVETSLAALLSNYTHITSITLTDGSTPTFAGAFSIASLGTNDPALAKITSSYNLTVSDTAADVQTDLQLGSPKLAAYSSHMGVGAITLTDGSTPTIALTMPQVSNSGSALTKITSAYLLNVTGTATQVETDLALGASSKLQAISLAGDLGTITFSAGTTITLTVDQLAHVGAVLSHLGANTIVLSDTTANIQTDLALGVSSKLVGAATKIASFTLPGHTGTISLTAAQILVAGVNDGTGSAIAKLATEGATLVATNVSVAQITSMTGLGSGGTVQPSSLQIKDAAATIQSDIAGSALIAASIVNVTSVTTTETTLSAAAAAAIYTAFTTAFVESGLTITDTAANLLATNASTPLALSRALLTTVSDSPTNLTAAQATTLLTILGGSLTGGHTMTITDTSANLLAASAGTLSAATTVTLSAPVTLTAANATLLAALSHFSTAGSALTVQDTAANLLNVTNANGILAATTTKLLANQTVTAATLTALSALHGYSAGATLLTVQDTAANIAGLGATPLGFAATAAVSDTVSGFTANVAGLQAAATAQKLTVTLTGTSAGSLAITTTDTAYAANPSVYAAITNTGVVRVNGSASGLAAIASQLTTNAAVTEVNVTDSSASILSRLTTLNSMGAKFHSAIVTDTSINAAGVASLLSIPNLAVQTSLTVTDTGAQIAAAIQANAGGLAFINSTGVSAVLSANSVVDAAGASTLSAITAGHLTKGSYKIYIWDAASYLTNGGNAAALTFADGVYLKAVGNAAQVNAATANSLLVKLSVIDGSNPVPSGVTAASITVQDTAASLHASYATLLSNMSKITAFRVSAAATVSITVLGELRTLGATMATGSLTARDTAANMLAELASPHGASVTPVSWLLSASGTVTTANAVTLAGLSGFSAGAYNLTLSANATISVVDANTLGTIRTSLLMGGFTVHVAGTVAQVSALSSDAKLIVAPDITDTFVNVSTLTTGSGLLGGTIAISDTASVTVAQAASFLALIGGSGIPAANVSFASHIESVTDTLTNIQTLTALSGWTSNAGIRAGFHLTVADTVATLINGSNTVALGTMYATTLAANSTVTAAAAESLFGLTGTIHFTKGTHTLTVQDSAANLLNPVNADALTIADTVQLSADDAVNAADAETLLNTTHFSLNHVLTITDNSANLLDGVLATKVAGLGSNVIVHLTGAETVDAGTATALVALHGFADPSHYLAIADSASYLINAANAAAEHLANSVTLTGDETVSITTAAKLDVVEHFSLGSNTLHLASNDYADQAGLKAIGDFNTHFDFNGFNVTVTQDGLALTPGEYAVVNGNNHLTMNGHVVSAMLDGVVVTSGSSSVTVTGTGVVSATLHVYADDGTSPGGSANINGSGAVTVTVTESSIHNKAVVITETVGGVESAPIIAIEQTVLTNAATAFGATFATSGAVQVGVGQFADLYTAVNAPAHPTNPILVYDPNAHTLSLNVDGHAPVTLVTLGSSTTPSTLTAAEIFIQHFT